VGEASSWGVAVATIFACAIFAAISGSSTATVATIGLIVIIGRADFSDSMLQIEAG
jgi:TRAP-type C4-dicarboxylate transport system permease large subunit